MRHLKLLPRLILLLVVIAATPFLLMATLVQREEVDRARARYEIQAAEVRHALDELKSTEERLQRLTSSVEAVEVEARKQLRLARPDEKFVLVNYEGQ